MVYCNMLYVCRGQCILENRYEKVEEGNYWMMNKIETENTNGIDNIYKLTVEDVYKTLQTRPEGLTISEVQKNQKNMERMLSKRKRKNQLF